MKSKLKEALEKKEFYEFQLDEIEVKINEDQTIEADYNRSI